MGGAWIRRSVWRRWWPWPAHGLWIGILLLCIMLFVVRLDGSLPRIDPHRAAAVRHRSSRIPSPEASQLAISSDPTNANMKPKPKLKPTKMKKKKKKNSSSSDEPRVALCLVGGARDFEVTGPSIRRHLLRGLPPRTDVFVNAPLDADSYKLSLLRHRDHHIRLIHLRIFEPQPIAESAAHAELLTSIGSPNGIQGLLQYFNLVEGCVRMIGGHQRRHNFTYEWVVRARLDAYWNGRPPALGAMDRGAYNVPSGSRYGGLNDRLGIGSWGTSERALSRLSALDRLHALGRRGLNSEACFEQQLAADAIPYRLHDFPFCVLSRRRYPWPPGVPVASASTSAGPLSGAKCRPCRPVVVGAAALSVVDALDRDLEWIGNARALDLCNATDAWDRDWRDLMPAPDHHDHDEDDHDPGFDECVRANDALRKDVRVWDAPSPRAICDRALLAEPFLRTR